MTTRCALEEISLLRCLVAISGVVLQKPPKAKKRSRRYNERKHRRYNRQIIDINHFITNRVQSTYKNSVTDVEQRIKTNFGFNVNPNLDMFDNAKNIIMNMKKTAYDNRHCAQ